jgi:elongation factor G
MNNGLNRVFFRETVEGSGVGEGKVIRQRGGVGVYAHVRVAVHALSRGRGKVFAWNAGSNIPAKFAPAVAQGVQDAMNAGVLAGLELIDVHASVEDGSYHEGDSTADAFREAARKAAAQALREAQPLILEALSLVSITVPVEFIAEVQATLTSHGGQVMRSEIQPQAITASLRASRVDDLFGELLEITGGHAKISSTSAGFRPRPEPPDTVEQWVARG